MFSLLDKYITRHVISATMGVVLVMVLLRGLFSLVDELGDLGKGTYQFSDALLFVGLMIPYYLVEFFPMGALIGSLLGLGTLAQNNELTVMRAAGVTTWRIVGSTLKAAAILVTVLFFFSEWIAPVASQTAQKIRLSAISGGDLAVSATGMWVKRDKEIIQIGSIQSDGSLRDLTIYQVDEQQRLKGLLRASTATEENADNKTGNQTEWWLQNVERIQFLDDKVDSQSSAREQWLRPLDKDKIETLTLDPESMNLSELISYLRYLRSNDMDTGIFELAKWRKILQPLAISVMIFLAASFVFGPMRNVSMGARIMSGVMLGFGFHLANQSFGPVSLVYGLSPAFGAVLPVILFGWLGYYLMKRAG